MAFIIKSLLILFIGVGILFYNASTVIADEQPAIRVSGINTPRNRFPIRHPNGGPPGIQQKTIAINGFLEDPSNFGETGVVPCAIDFNPFVDTVIKGSLVDESGNLLVDVFFAGPTETLLVQDEIDELVSFLNAGGILYISGDVNLPIVGPNYNVLFEALGASDGFENIIDPAGYPVQSGAIEHTTPVTVGPFGVVGNLLHGNFKVFTPAQSIGIARGFNSQKYVVAEMEIGDGRLVITGNPLYTSWFISDLDNKRYFLNMFALGCKQKEEDVPLDVPLFKQGTIPINDNNPFWESQEYDHGNSQTLWCGSTVAQCGCVTASAAMLLDYYGVDKDPFGNPTNPGSVNEYFKSRAECGVGGCISLGYAYGNVRWNGISKYSKDASDVYGTQKIIFNGGWGFDADVLKDELENDRPVILQNLARTHWFVATGVDGDTFSINDPYFDRTSLDDPAYGNTANAMRKFIPVSSDFSYLEFYSPAPVQILVTDSLGRRTGYDPETQTVLAEIPNSSYILEEPYSDATGESVNPQTLGVYWLLINTPSQGGYSVQVTSTDNGTYSFSAYLSEVDSDLDFDLFEGSGKPTYHFEYNSEDASVNPTFEIPIDIVPWRSRNKIFLRRGSLIPVAILSSEFFNPKDVNRKTITFGKTGEEKSKRFCLRPTVDFNRDGVRDIYCFFKSEKTGLSNASEKAILKATLRNGLALEGSDLVLVR